MTPDARRRAGRLVARHHRLDPAAAVMVGAVAETGQRGGATPSAEDRAELLSIAGNANGFERFIEAATSRAVQFASARWKTILEQAERMAERNAVVV